MIVPIKHILNEDGVSEIFKFIIPEGFYTGEYIIKKPEGWNEIDSIVDINEELFNVENFIIGETTKLKFTQFNNPEAYNLIRNVYREMGGDGRIIFKWIAVKQEIEYDLLSENFEINFNKYNSAFDKTLMVIEVELIKSEAQNKLYTREDTTVDLFETKDLDENDILPVEQFLIGYKKGDTTLTNFYTFDLSQWDLVNDERLDHFYSFRRSDDYEFGDNTNNYAGYRNFSFYAREDKGPFISTNITLKSLKLEIADMQVIFKKTGGGFPNVGLFAVVRNGNTNIQVIKLKDSETTVFPGESQIKIDFQQFNLDLILPDQSVNLQPGQNLTFMFYSNENVPFQMYLTEKNNTSIKITTDMESPLVRTTGIRLESAINQLSKNYTSGLITTNSFVLGEGGAFYNTSISTGMYLRGLPPTYLLQKIKTSINSLLKEGAAKLLALGYDVLNNKMIIENIDYFFKEFKTYDLSEKQYIRESFKIENDEDISFNSLLFGSKKYSTNFKYDIKNFNTSMELSTPVKSKKNKLDKQTDSIIDPYKIQELIEDKSTSTNDNDDDLVLIDMVEVVNYWDEGIFDSCSHLVEEGKLTLKCTSIPFDTTLMEVGKSVEIMEGLNVGTWTILTIDGFKLVLNKTSGIQEGVNDTRIKYQIDSLIKNRTIEGFTGYDDTIRTPNSTTNIRHNPKYQMARWFPFFGSGLRKKTNTELLKVTNYKNNSDAKMTINSADMANELQGNVVVGQSEELGRMRDFKSTFFNGEKINITYDKITFQEFFEIYTNWKFGENEDRTKSRGYLTCNTPEGIYDIYPFGPAAFSHNKAKNTLNIKGKVKGMAAESPVLLSVIQEDKNTVTLNWDYSNKYVNPTIKIQVSLDGVNWQTLKSVNNVKTDTFSDDYFDDIMTGNIVIFRVLITTADFSNKTSNTLSVEWQFNDWIVKEVSRTENVNCGNSYLTLEFNGNVDLELEWNFSSYPGGGSGNVIDLYDNSQIIGFTSPYGADYDEIQTTYLNLDHEVKQYAISVKNSNKSSDLKILNCSLSGTDSFVTAYIVLTIKDGIGPDVVKIIGVDTMKKYKDNGVIDPGV